MAGLVEPSAWAFYHPQAGRWLNRDPIGEKGGRAIYAFVRNAPVTQVDRLGQVSLESIGTPGITENGTYAFAAVWFNFSVSDYGQLGSSGGGTLVWSRQTTYDLSSCVSPMPPVSVNSTLWFRKGFQLDPMGSTTGGDLWSQGGTTPATSTGRGLGLEVTGQSVETLVQASGANWRYARLLTSCGTSGSLSVWVNWAILPQTLTGGSTASVFEAGWDEKTAHSAVPMAGWNDWGGAIAQGTMAVDVTWNQCVSPQTKSMSARSSLFIADGGPNRTGKRSQGEAHPWESLWW